MQLMLVWLFKEASWVLFRVRKPCFILVSFKGFREYYYKTLYSFLSKSLGIDSGEVKLDSCWNLLAGLAILRTSKHGGFDCCNISYWV